MTHKPARWMQDLAPIQVGRNRELRLQLVEINGKKRVRMATWCKGDREWVKLPGVVEIPTDLIPALHDRLNASVC